MSPRLLAALVGVLCLSVAVPALASKTRHEDWPKIDGRFRKDRHDRGKTYYGTKRHDELLGGHGNNHLYGGAKSDVLWGDYKPSGWPARQSDHVYGGGGDDFIFASHSFNHLEGNDGNDYIRAHFGYGSVDCGNGRDWLVVSHRSRPKYKISNCEKITIG
jgi:Ca2+-binding RTX toxin-like protein